MQTPDASKTKTELKKGPAVYTDLLGLGSAVMYIFGFVLLVVWMLGIAVVKGAGMVAVAVFCPPAGIYFGFEVVFVLLGILPKGI